MATHPDNSPQATAPPGVQYIRELDPFKVQAFQEQLQTEQTLLPGVIAGAGAALIGAVLWALITVVTNYQIGWMAIGIGFLVGWAMRLFGKGRDKLFGFVGAGLALLGCIAGNLFMLAALMARAESASLIEVLGFMLLNPGADLELLARTFSPIDLLFYAIALYYGYKYSLRQITPAERESLYRTRAING